MSSMMNFTQLLSRIEHEPDLSLFKATLQQNLNIMFEKCASLILVFTCLLL